MPAGQMVWRCPRPRASEATVLFALRGHRVSYCPTQRHSAPQQASLLQPEAFPSTRSKGAGRRAGQALRGSAGVRASWALLEHPSCSRVSSPSKRLQGNNQEGLGPTLGMEVF